jgi:glycosyltransferase involved in cell wall biosynthesis
MRILIATGILKPEVGGPATLALELAKRLQATGHKVTVVTYSDHPSFHFDSDFQFKLIRVVRNPNKLLNYFAYFTAIKKEMKKSEVVYSLDWFSGGLPLMLAAKLMGKQYIVRVGGGYIWEKYLMEGRPPVTLKAFYEKRMHKAYKVLFFVIKRVLKNAQYVVFNSDIQRELYIKVYGLNLQRVLTINNAIPENRLSGLVNNYNNEYVERDKEIVFAGRFIKMKNVESLVKAFAKVHDQSFKLILIGNGPTEPELRRLVSELGLAERVEFLPTMSQSDLYKRISHVHVVVIPSWTDVSPHQAYECLALGIPMLITKENYLSIASKFKTTIDPASIDDIVEKLNMLIDDKNAYARFVSEQKNIHFNHPWTRVIEEHIHLFMKSQKYSHDRS